MEIKKILVFNIEDKYFIYLDFWVKIIIEYV